MASESGRKTGSASSSPKTPSTPIVKKQVGFAKTRPTLMIPPPQDPRLPQQFTATSRISARTPYSIDHRKQSVFNFDQLNGIRDFTKTGLGVGEKCAYWLYSKVRTWSRKWFTHFFLTIVLLLYTIGGALLFEFIEGENEAAVERDLRSARNKLIRELRNLSLVIPEEKSLEEWEGAASRRMKVYEGQIVDWYATHKLIMSKTRQGKMWTFLDAVVYCSTIYTTIGYGHIYPDTKTGKALTIVYAIIGIPLFLLALTDFGKLFTRCIKFLWSFVRRVYYTGSCRQVRKSTHAKEIFKGAQMMYDIATFRRPSAIPEAENPDPEAASQIAEDTPTTPAISNFEINDEFNLPISVAIFILVLYIFLGGVIYCMWENWNFFDAFYFVFISMSTIGFGDVVPKDAACMIVTIVYLVFGLALMSMCINVVQEKLSDTFRQASTKIGATMGIDVVDDDGSIVTVPPDGVELPPVHDTHSLKSTKSEEVTEKED